MSIPTESERLAKYKADMAATVAGQGRASSVQSGYQGPGNGCLQTSDTARHINKMAQRKEAQIADKLSPTEIIAADSAARQLARKHASYAGRTLSDTDIQRAGREGVRAAAGAKS
jgi:hypothetical protein